MYESVLVANRGEVARRVIRTVRAAGLKAIAVYSEADAGLPHVREADEAILLGPAPPAESYLDAARVLEAVRRSGAQAVHPGYGFLSEDPDFAAGVLDAGAVWIGPPPEVVAAMGDKITARNRMAAAGVPVAAGTTEPLDDVDAALAAADRLGYPLMVKASAGGGIGMSVAADPDGLRTAFGTARARAERLFSSPAVLLERYLPRARHVEVQLLGLADGRVVALGERDCSVQRRRQKVVGETPSPGVSPQLRARLLAAAVLAGETVGYRNAGTVEFLLDVDTSAFVFLEMNTRLQVEHPVTELVTGLDLVAEQLLVAAGEPPSFGDTPPEPAGYAIEARVYAEDPVRFLPGPGRITRWREPHGEGVRVDAGYAEGDTVTPFYDPLLAKLAVYGGTRERALARLGAAVADFEIAGPKVNLPFVAELLADPGFAAGDYDTGIVGRLRPADRPVRASGP